MAVELVFEITEAIMNVVKLSIFSLCLTACASSSFKEKTFRNMIVASAVGLAIGQTEKENKGSYSLIYGGGAAATAAVASILAYDPDKEIEKATGVSKEVSDSLEQALQNPISKKYYDSNKQGSSLRNFNQLPERYRKLINPGEWRLSQISEWEQLDDFTLVHKTELLEIRPPELKINQNERGVEK